MQLLVVFASQCELALEHFRNSRYSSIWSRIHRGFLNNFSVVLNHRWANFLTRSSHWILKIYCEPFSSVFSCSVCVCYHACNASLIMLMTECENHISCNQTSSSPILKTLPFVVVRCLYVDNSSTPCNHVSWIQFGKSHITTIWWGVTFASFMVSE